MRKLSGEMYKRQENEKVPNSETTVSRLVEGGTLGIGIHVTFGHVACQRFIFVGTTHFVLLPFLFTCFWSKF